MVETEAGLEIVDWKTDDISASEVAGRLKEYELQAGLYVLGLDAATGRPVARVTYVFVGPGVEATRGPWPTPRERGWRRPRVDRSSGCPAQQSPPRWPFLGLGQPFG